MLALAGVFWFPFIAAEPAPGPAKTPSQIDVVLMDPVPISGINTDATKFAEKTPFQKMEELYEHARPAPLDESKVVWMSGRCFFQDRPMQALASVIVPEKSSATQGPLFKGPAFDKLVPLLSRRGPPETFDDPTPAIRKKIEDLLPTLREDLAYPVRGNGEIRIDVFRSTKFQARQFFIRQIKNYVFLRMNCSEAGGCWSTSGARVSFLEDEPAAYCYYFKKMKR